MGTGGSLFEFRESCKSSNVWYCWITCVNSTAAIWTLGTMLMVAVKVSVAGVDSLSATWNVIAVLPVSVGLPVMSPLDALSVSPAGSVPLMIVHV